MSEKKGMKEKIEGPDAQQHQTDITIKLTDYKKTIIGKNKSQYKTFKDIKYSKDEPINLFITVREFAINEGSYQFEKKDDDEYTEQNFKKKLNDVIEQYKKLSRIYREKNIKFLFWKYLEEQNTKMKEKNAKDKRFYIFDYEFLKKFYGKIESWIRSTEVGVIIKFGTKITVFNKLTIYKDYSCWDIHKQLDRQMSTIAVKDKLYTNHTDFMKNFNGVFDRVQLDDQKKLIINESCNNFRLDFGHVFVSGEGSVLVIINYGSASNICDYIRNFEWYKTYAPFSNKSVHNAINEYKARQKLKEKLENKLGKQLRSDVFTFSEVLRQLDPTKLLDCLDKMYVIDEAKYNEIEGFPKNPTEEIAKDYGMKWLYRKETELHPVLIHFNKKYRSHLDEISFLEFDNDYNINQPHTKIQLIEPLIVQPEES